MIFIHKTAEVSPKAKIGEGTKIWHQSHVREGVVIGENCILGKGVYIDFDVKVGSNVKIQNYASVYHGSVVEDGVFIGPYVSLLNDKNPRSVNVDGSLKADGDWEESGVSVRRGASIGAGSTLLPGVTIGSFALVGAGSVVTKNVPDHGLVYGNPAKLADFVCQCGKTLKVGVSGKKADLVCDECQSGSF